DLHAHGVDTDLRAGRHHGRGHDHPHHPRPAAVSAGAWEPGGPVRSLHCGPRPHRRLPMSAGIPASLIDAYLAGPTQLRQAVVGMTRDQVLARPVAGKWSTLEVVCHLADFDPILADRMKRII